MQKEQEIDVLPGEITGQKEDMAGKLISFLQTTDDVK
jgi:hypothetical protein